MAYAAQRAAHRPKREHVTPSAQCPCSDRRWSSVSRQLAKSWCRWRGSLSSGVLIVPGARLPRPPGQGANVVTGSGHHSTWSLAENTAWGKRQEANRRAEPAEMRAGALDSLMLASPGTATCRARCSSTQSSRDPSGDVGGAVYERGPVSPVAAEARAKLSGLVYTFR